MCTWRTGTRTNGSSKPCAALVSRRSRNAFMPQLIRNRAVVADDWTLLRDASEPLAGLGTFAGIYAPTSRTPQPWFRRRDSSNGRARGRDELDRRVADVVDLLRHVATHHAPAVLATGFGAEGMLLIDLIA